MAKIEKKIRLYKRNEDGSLNKDYQLLPETNIESVIGLEEELGNYVTKDTEIGGTEIGEGIDYLNNLHYDRTEKVISPLIDGKTYDIPLNYDDTITSTGNVVGDYAIPHIGSYTPTCDNMYVAGSNVVIVYLLDDWDPVNNEFIAQYIYHQDGPSTYNWYISLGGTETKLVEPLEFTLALDKVIPGREDILKYILGVEDTVVEYDRTLEDVKEDLPNWTYSKETETKYIYGIEDGKDYKVNFNVNNYLTDLSTFGDRNTFYNASTSVCEGYQTAPATLRINFNNTTYWFIIDVTDTVNFGAWRKGNSSNPDNGSNIYNDAYTPEELSNVTFTLDITKVPSDETLLGYFKNIILNEDGSAVTDLVNGNTYKVNFANSSAFKALLDYYFNNITLGGLEIYNPNVDTNSIRIWNSAGGTYGLRLRFYDSTAGSSKYYYFLQELGNYYPGRWYNQNYRNSNYRYNDEDLQNVSFTMVRDAIINETLLRKIITELDGSPIPEDHEETIVTDEKTLKEYLEDYKNWEYENTGIVGILNTPDWKAFDGLLSGDIYEDRNTGLRIFYALSPLGMLSLNILDIPNETRYTIINKDYDSPEGYFKANTWYTSSASIIAENLTLTECDAPDLILENQYIINEDLFKAIYGERTFTLSQKIDSINRKVNNIEPLKDKIYDGDEGNLVNGKSYTLSDNYNDFFEKYSEAENTLIYGYPTEIEPKSGNTKAGISVAPISKNQILSIFLWTDASPVRDGNSGTKDGGMSLLGSTYIELTTTEGILYFYKDDNSWTYEGNEVPLENIPQLELNSELIRDEQMLKDFLKLENTLRTLKEKFDEVEAIINAPLKDKVYTYIGGDANLTNGEKYSFKENIDDFFTKGYEYQDIYDINGGGGVTPVTPVFSTSGAKAPSIEVGDVEREEYICYITYVSGKGIFVKVTTNITDYYYTQSDGHWTDSNGDLATLPELAYQEEYVLNKVMLKDILALSAPQTLEEKFNEGIKSWVYETADPQSGIEEKVYNVKMSDIDVDASDYGANYAIAIDKNGVELCFYGNINSVVLINYYDDANDLDLYFDPEQNAWTEFNGDLYSGDPLTFDVDLTNIQDPVLLKKILGISDVITTLEEKLDQIENAPLKDKTYETYLDETKKAFKTSIDWSVFEDLELGDTFIYGTSEENPNILISKNLINENEIAYIITYMLEGKFGDASAKGYLISNQDTAVAEANNWIYMDTTGEEPIAREEVPQPFVYDSEKIQDIILFDCICEDAIIKQTLEDKILDLPNWEYRDSSVLRPVVLPDWEAISELDNWEEDQIVIYGDVETMSVTPIIGIERGTLADGYIIRIVDSFTLSPYSAVAYMISSVDIPDHMDANKWYRVTSVSGQADVAVEVSVDDIPDYIFNNAYMLRQDAFDLIYQGKVGTLAEKLDSIEAPYSIVGYNATSGTLNSITVKSKETGDETTLTIAQDKPIYQHIVKVVYSTFSPKVYIVSDSNIAFTLAGLKQWLTDKGFTSISNSYEMIFGNIQVSGTFSDADGIFVNNDNICIKYTDTGYVQIDSVGIDTIVAI